MRSQWGGADGSSRWGGGRGRGASGRVVAVAACAVAALLVAAFVVAMVTRPADAGPDTADGTTTVDTTAPVPGEDGAQYPGDGRYVVQVFHTGYCLGHQDNDDADGLAQLVCGDVDTGLNLVETSTTGSYVFGVERNDKELGCLARVPGSEPGVAIAACDDSDDQVFSLAPVADGSYRVMSSDRLCLDVVDRSAEPGASVTVAECAESVASQQFAFEADGATASRPTKLGAWWARDGVYEAKWEEPDDDGGLEITGYVMRDCDGTELASVDGATFGVQVEIASLTCVSLRAINAAGEGAEATTEVVQK